MGSGATTKSSGSLAALVREAAVNWVAQTAAMAKTSKNKDIVLVKRGLTWLGDLREEGVVTRREEQEDHSRGREQPPQKPLQYEAAGLVRGMGDCKHRWG